MIDTFDWWLQKVPVVIPRFDGSFDQWDQLVPDVEIGASFGVSSSAFSGIGISGASVQINYLLAIPASGIGISTASAGLGCLMAGQALGVGISTASASLGSLGITLRAAGLSAALASASLSSFSPAPPAPPAPSIPPTPPTPPTPPALPAPPGFLAIQQGGPVSLFGNGLGFGTKPVLDVLMLRYPRIKYVSPPVCPMLTPKSGSSSMVCYAS